MSEWLRKFTVGTGWESTHFSVDVELYADKPSLLAVAEREHGWQPEGTDAVTHCYLDGESPQALIRLPLDDFTIRLVAHEAAHAAVHLTGLLIDTLPTGEDERIPWFAGELTAAIWSLGATSANTVPESEPK